MLSDLVPCLHCPKCFEALVQSERALRCANSHSYDIARHGYVNLLPGDARPGTADAPQMVDARDRFLASGHYDFIAQALAAAAAEADKSTPAATCVADIGGGTGYYLAHVLDAVPERLGVVVDISKYAARRAARSHPRAAAVVADIWNHIPLADGVVAVGLNVFAPRNAEEMARVLHSQGRLVVVTPTSEHLHEIIGTLGLLTVDEDKGERLSASLSDFFEPMESIELRESLSLTRADLLALVSMGPSAYHTNAETLAEKIAGFDEPISVSAAMRVATYSRR